jgi:hypothetical protein
MADSTITITYGGVSFGSTARPTTGPIHTEKSFERFVCEFAFIIAKQTAADFDDEILAVEDAFRKPFQSLTVAWSGVTMYTFSQSSNTGLDAKAEILSVRDSVAQTGRSRQYTVRITLGLPANTGAEQAVGLRDLNVQVEYLPSRRRLITIAGVVTAAGGSAARTQYESVIDALVTSILSDLSVTTSELVGEPVTRQSVNNKTIEFERRYNELIFEQGGAGIYDADIVNQILVISRRRVAPGDAPNARRLITLDLNYDAWINKNNTTNLTGKWENTIRPWLVQHAQTTANAGTAILLVDDPRYDRDNNRITATMTVATTNGSNTIEEMISAKWERTFGGVLVARWSGDPDAKRAFQGPAGLRLTVTNAKTVVGFQSPPPFDALTDGGVKLIEDAGVSGIRFPQGYKALHMTEMPDHKWERRGLDGFTLNVTVITRVDVFELYKDEGAATFSTQSAAGSHLPPVPGR